MAALTDLGVARKLFIHINNTNPILCAGSPERAAVEVEIERAKPAYTNSRTLMRDVLSAVLKRLDVPDDPRILNTVKVIDALLQVKLLQGPCWYRYNGDGYGEHSDGSPFDGTGMGRPWPLLSGERAHYELAAGRPKVATHLLGVMRAQANRLGGTLERGLSEVPGEWPAGGIHDEQGGDRTLVGIHGVQRLAGHRARSPYLWL